jgi:hypothetical protein
LLQDQLHQGFTIQFDQFVSAHRDPILPNLTPPLTGCE